VIRSIYFEREGWQYRAECLVVKNQIVSASLYQRIGMDWLMTVETWQCCT